MPWSELAGWLAAQPARSAWPVDCMTLVTLSLNGSVRPEELEFYRCAEQAALSEWAVSGGFILALAATERAELTMLCPDTAEQVSALVDRLPLVTAGLACSDVRAVRPVRVGPPKPMARTGFA